MKVKYSYREERILATIAETTPFPLNEVKKVYFMHRSFDQTILTLEELTSKGLGIESIVQP